MSRDTLSQDRVSHEVASEGPRRIIFDVENISEHEKAAGAKSEGLTLRPCCDYNEGKPVLLCDLEIVFLVLMRLRTSEVRELQYPNARSSIIVTVSGSVMEARLEQLQNALLPTLVRVSGSVTEVRA